MAVEAPISKFKKNNLIIYIVACLALAIWCTYDGYFNEDWIKDHTNPDNTPQAYLVFNQKAPYFLVGAAVVLAAYFFAIKNKKIIADEKELIIDGKTKIPYDCIEKLDKTNFDSKGFFLMTYKDVSNAEKQLKLSDKKYDNLSPIIDKLVEEIS